MSAVALRKANPAVADVAAVTTALLLPKYTPETAHNVAGGFAAGTVRTTATAAVTTLAAVASNAGATVAAGRL